MSIVRDFNINIVSAVVWALGIQPLATKVATMSGLTWLQAFGWVGLASVCLVFLYFVVRWTRVQIVAGYYGYGPDHYIDVGDHLRGYLKDGGLRVTVSNQALVGGNHDDPFPGQIKQLVVIYQLGSERRVMVEREGQTMRIQRRA